MCNFIGLHRNCIKWLLLIFEVRDSSGTIDWYHFYHLITNGTIGKEMGANAKNGTNDTNRWYHCVNAEHMLSQLSTA